jgi:hypothetical protein
MRVGLLTSSVAMPGMEMGVIVVFMQLTCAKEGEKKKKRKVGVGEGER